MALRAGADLPPAFGPDSFWRHVTCAEQRGLSVGLMATNSLSRDVDRPEDLIGVCEAGPDSRTAAFLRERLQPRIRS
jgi:2-phospho-L-lactate guanylyltransferase (CobY/MobA/RfbA family)